MIEGISSKKEEGMNVLTSEMEGIKAFVTNTSKNAVPVEIVSLSSEMTSGSDSIFDKVPFFSETQSLLTNIDSNIESLSNIFEIQSRDILLNPTPEDLIKAKTLSSAIPMGFLMLHDDLSKLIEDNEVLRTQQSSSSSETYQSSNTGFNLKNTVGQLGTVLATSYVVAQAADTIAKALASGINLFTNEDVKAAFAGKQAAILEAEAQREVDLILNHDWTFGDVLSGSTSIDQVFDTFMDIGERGIKDIAIAKSLLKNSKLQKVLAGAEVYAAAGTTVANAARESLNLFTDDQVKQAFADAQAKIITAEAENTLVQLDSFKEQGTSGFTVEDILSGKVGINSLVDTGEEVFDTVLLSISKVKNIGLYKAAAVADIASGAMEKLSVAARESLNLFNDETVKQAFADAQARIITAEAERTILQIENGLVSAHDMENAVDKGLSLAGEIMLGIQTGGISFMIDGAINLLSKWAEKGAETVANIQTMFTDEVKKASAEGQARVIQAEYTAMAKAYESEIIQNAMVASLAKEMTIEKTISTPFQAINGIIKGIGSTVNTLKEVVTGSEEKSQTQAVDFVDKIYGISNNEISSILDTFEFNPEDSNSIREQIVLSTRDTLDKYLGLVRDNLDLDVSVESNREQRSLQLDTLEDNILKVMGTVIDSTPINLGNINTRIDLGDFNIEDTIKLDTNSINDTLNENVHRALESVNMDFSNIGVNLSSNLRVNTDILTDTINNSLNTEAITNTLNNGLNTSVLTDAINNSLNVETVKLDTRGLYSPVANLNELLSDYVSTVNRNLDTEFSSFTGFDSSQMSILNDTLVESLDKSINNATIEVENKNQFSIGNRTPSDDPLLMSSWRLEEQTRAIFEYLKVINNSLSLSMGTNSNINIFNTGNSNNYIEEPGV